MRCCIPRCFKSDVPAWGSQGLLCTAGQHHGQWYASITGKTVSPRVRQIVRNPPSIPLLERFPGICGNVEPLIPLSWRTHRSRASTAAWRSASEARRNYSVSKRQVSVGGWRKLLLVGRRGQKTHNNLRSKVRRNDIASESTDAARDANGGVWTVWLTPVRYPGGQASYRQDNFHGRSGTDGSMIMEQLRQTHYPAESQLGEPDKAPCLDWRFFRRGFLAQARTSCPTVHDREAPATGSRPRPNQL